MSPILTRFSVLSGCATSELRLENSYNLGKVMNPCVFTNILTDRVLSSWLETSPAQEVTTAYCADYSAKSIMNEKKRCSH